METSALNRSLRRLGALALLVVLALGPFLHAHLGQSHLVGFHIDGMLPHSLTPSSDVAMTSTTDESEAPAIGVTSSLPRPAKDPASVSDLAIWSCVLLLCVLPMSVTQRVTPSRAVRPTRRLHYPPGWPPPLLAPPRI